GGRRRGPGDADGERRADRRGRPQLRRHRHCGGSGGRRSCAPSVARVQLPARGRAEPLRIRRRGARPVPRHRSRAWPVPPPASRRPRPSAESVTQAYAATAVKTSINTIAAVPFTLRNLKEDLEDLGSNFDGAPDLEFRLASRALELEQCGLGYQRIPPDYRFPSGHTHKEQEEIFVVVGGSGRRKLDAEIVEVKKWDVARVPPGTGRGTE